MVAVVTAFVGVGYNVDAVNAAAFSRSTDKPIFVDTSSVITGDLVIVNDKTGISSTRASIVVNNEGSQLTFQEGDLFASDIDDDYTAWATASNSETSTINFNGGNVTLNAVSPYGAQALNSRPTTQNFNNSGKVSVNSIVEGSGVGRSNAIGINLNGSSLSFASSVEDLTVNVVGSGRFSGDALDSNGTAGIRLAGGPETKATFNAKNINVKVIVGQDYSQTIQLGPTESKDYQIIFDREKAEKLGTEFAVSYGLENKSDTVFGKDTNTSIVVKNGYWNAVGISNDSLYVDYDKGEPKDHSEHNASNLKILGNLNVSVEGSSLGAKHGYEYTKNPLYTRLEGTYALYAYNGLHATDNSARPENIVTLGSQGKTVVLSAKDLSQTDYDSGVYGIFARDSKVTIEGSSITVTAEADKSAVAVDASGAAVLSIGTSESNTLIEAVSKNNLSTALRVEGEGTSVTFGGFTTLKADNALVGNGTVNALSSSTLIIDGGVNNWTGTLNVEGNVAIGVEAKTAKALLTNSAKPTLLLSAGTVIAGSINLGNAPEPAAATRSLADSISNEAASSITLDGNGTLLILPNADYDGSSPLVNVDEVSAGKDSSVYVVNSTKVADGTVVFNVKDSDAVKDYSLATDNLLKKVVDNTIVTEKAETVFNGSALLSNTLNESFLSSGLGAKRLVALTSWTTLEKAAAEINKIALMGTASGAQNISINTASLIGDTITRHGSVLASETHEKTGADLWIDVNGSFSKASSLAAGSQSYGYKSDMSLITIGSDYAIGNGVAAGAAVNFGKGSVRGQGVGSGTKNNVDFWGLNAYGVWSTGYANLVGTVGYLESTNEITQTGYKGKPKVKAFSTEVRAEKPIAVSETIQVTPHVGLRYLHVDMDGFSAGGFKYGFEKSNLVQTPVGVAFNANLKASCGADVLPFVDVEVAPAFGDKKVKHTVALENSSAGDSFKTRIAEDALYTGRVGVSAAKGNHALSFSYGVSGGNDGRVDQNLKARYRYQF